MNYIQDSHLNNIELEYLIGNMDETDHPDIIVRTLYRTDKVVLT